MLLMCSDTGGMGAGGRCLGSRRSHTWLKCKSDGEVLSHNLCYSNCKSTSGILDGGMALNQLYSVPEGELASVKTEISYIIAHQAPRVTACPP